MSANILILIGIQSFVTKKTALKGIRSYKNSILNKSQLSWDNLMAEHHKIDLSEELDNLEMFESEGEIEETLDISQVNFSDKTLEELEAISNFNWNLDGEMESPFRKYNGKTELLAPSMFCCSPMKAFLRYTPLVFWKQV
jgi:hypothetical protein